MTLDEVGAELAKLPRTGCPRARTGRKLSSGWAGRIDERIAELRRLRAGLTGCIGCGCLSLDRCALANPPRPCPRSGPRPAVLGDRSQVAMSCDVRRWTRINEEGLSCFLLCKRR